MRTDTKSILPACLPSACLWLGRLLSHEILMLLMTMLVLILFMLLEIAHVSMIFFFSILLFSPTPPGGKGGLFLFLFAFPSLFLMGDIGVIYTDPYGITYKRRLFLSYLSLSLSASLSLSPFSPQRNK